MKAPWATRMSDEDTREWVREVVDALRAKGWRCATAESCTGGGIAARITDLAGSSEVFDRGFITYSNASKATMLGVDPALIDAHGAVSEPVAQAMAAGAIAHSDADCACSVTGVAGPGGGTPDKPVGMVCFGWATRGGSVETETVHFPGDRANVRKSAVDHALRGLLKVVGRPLVG
ncbi:MAG: CinA family protein [Casimicrobiaceae bacterium]